MSDDQSKEITVARIATIITALAETHPEFTPCAIPYNALGVSETYWQKLLALLVASKLVRYEKKRDRMRLLAKGVKLAKDITQVTNDATLKLEETQ